MAVRVDAEERRSLLAHAVWRLVARQGVSAASVRSIARETGLSMGSIRHFFSTQDELWRFAVAELVEHVSRRIEAGTPTRKDAVNQGRPLDAALALLEELLPLDEHRLLEARVWAAFTVPPAKNAKVADIRRHAHAQIRRLCQGVLAFLDDNGHVHPNRNPGIEAERLHALLDGLTVHLLPLKPVELVPDRVRAVLVTHLHDLRAAPHT